MAGNCRYYLPSPSKTPGEFSVKKGQDTVPFGETWQDRKVIGFKHPVNHDKTERAWLGRRTREKTGKGNQIIPLRFQTKGEHQTSLSFLWASEPRKTPAVLQCTQTMFSACCVESRVTSQPGRNTCTITLCTQKHLQYYTMHIETEQKHSSGAVWESRWPSWAVHPNEPSGFRGRKELLNRALALVTTCP